MKRCRTWQSLALRVGVLFVFFFHILTVADHATTRIGLGMGYRETNPFIDFTSSWTIWRSELAVLVFCLLLLTTGVFFGWTLVSNAGESFADFHKDLSAPRHTLLSGMLLGPFVLVVGRFFIVLNNLGLIVFGWGIVAYPHRVITTVFGVPEVMSSVFIYATMFMLLWKPTSWLLWRLAIGRSDHI